MAKRYTVKETEMANYPIDLVCDICYELLEWDIIQGANIDRIYVKPCKKCRSCKHENLPNEDGWHTCPDCDQNILCRKIEV